MKRVWKQREGAGPESGTELSEFSPIVSKLLFSRGIDNLERAHDFLEPDYGKAHDPFLMTDMAVAVDRIVEAIQKKQKITVYADYDADAVTAAAVLLRFFEMIDFQNVDYYIPDRFSEGYGVNADAIEKLAEKGTELIVTVDCGINAFEAAAKAKELGLDLVITDHHQVPPSLPEAVAAINPHRTDDKYPFKDLTGVGVAFKLVQALASKLSNTNFELQVGYEKWLLDLVAIGTVADCQSLLGENRIFVKWGLYVLQKSKWLGLRELLRVSGVTDQPLDTYHIGFVIAPRINAAGRLEHAGIALDLLLTSDQAEAERLVEKLDRLNKRRQSLTEQILSEAREQLISRKEEKVLLAAGLNWPEGVVGLVAGRLTEEFARPVLVLSQGESGEAVGSARSVRNFNIVEAIGASEQILVRYGGHPQAAGFTIRNEHIEIFQRNLLEFAESNISESDLDPVLYYDESLGLSDVDYGFVELLDQFAPFGAENPRPRFRLNALAVESVRAVGKEGKHLRLTLQSDGQRVNAIAFNKGFWAEKLIGPVKIDVIAEAQFNDWKGERSIQLKIVDLRESEQKHED